MDPPTLEMSQTTAEGRRAARVAGGDGTKRIQRDLFEAVQRSADRRAMIAAVDRLSKSVLGTTATLYFSRDESGQLRPQSAPGPDASSTSSHPLAGRLLQICRHACQRDEAYVDAAARHTAVVAPVRAGHEKPDALALVLPPGCEDSSSAVVVVQLLAAGIVLWHALNDSRDASVSASTSEAIVDLVVRTQSAENVDQACLILVNELQAHLRCRQVSIGLCRGRRGRACRLRAVSGVSRPDRGGAFGRAMESVFDETRVRDAISTWPLDDDSDRHALLAHRAAGVSLDADDVVSCPLKDGDGQTLGVLVLLDMGTPEQRSAAADFLRAAAPSIAACLRLLKRNGHGPLGRLRDGVRRRSSRTTAGIVLAATALLGVAMCVPIDYRIGCDCQIEPVTRRFVTAPFDGTLKEVLAQPGDLVVRDTLLARMDEREIRWELSTLEAEHKRAEKSRDSAMVEGRFAEAQVHRLEMDSLELKMQLLRHRAEHLEIRSPIDGIVTSGDLERVEGARLKVGQSLFEIAPLESMIVEIAVPDEEISHVRDGMPARIELDAYSGRVWTKPLTRLQPRSEQRDHRNVFVAEVGLENEQGLLRPGMKGRAKIVSSPRPIGWILFHKPWRALTQLWW